MTPEQENHLNDEVAAGRQAENVYRAHIKPFVEEKELVCFEAFKAVSVMDVDGLLEVKRQLMAIHALEEDFMSKMNTGKMAQQMLDKAAETQKDKETTE